MGGMGGGGMQQLFEPPVNSRDLDKYAQILSLDKEQTEALTALLEASQDLAEELTHGNGRARAATAHVSSGIGQSLDAFLELKLSARAKIVFDRLREYVLRAGTAVAGKRAACGPSR